MRILVINPNTTAAMTSDIERDPDAAQREITAEASKAIASDGAEALSGYGLATSRVAAFKRPETKELTGETDVLRAFRVGAAAAEPLRT